MTSVGLGVRRAPLAIPALGIVQILNWGSTYYLPAVIGRQIVGDTGWSYGVVIGGLSIGLGIAGLASMRVGRIIEQHGGRPVLSIAAIILAIGLALLSVAPNVPAYFGAWCVIGLGMGAGLYDVAFSTLGRLYGQDARRAISTLTLWSGFASTICWPLSAFLVDHIGWRGACMTYAGLHLVLGLPLVRGLIPDVPKPVAGATRATTAFVEPAPLDHRLAALILLSAILTLGGTINALLSVHLITFLQAGGVSYAVAVGLGTLIGPAQVASRVAERLMGARLHPIWTLLLAGFLMAAGLSLLAFGASLAAVALIAYGAGAGIWSIARGTLPLALFGSRGYPELMGRLATPTLIAQAVSPSVGAVLVDHVGVAWTQDLLAGGAIVAFGGIAALLTLTRHSIIGQ